MRYHIVDLFTQTKDTDPDLRFMALNDLEKEVLSAPESFQQSEKNEYSGILLRCLDDEASSVRTQALKCYESFTPIMGSLSTSVITTLTKRKTDKISITSSIYTMAIHNIVKNLPSDESIERDIIKIGLQQIFSSSQNFFKTIDYIEILSDLLEFLGTSFSSSQLTNTAQLLIDASYKADAVISKKSIVSLNTLARSITSQDQLTVLLSKISANSNTSTSTKTQITTFGILNNLIRGNPALLGNHIQDLWTTVVDGLKLDSLHTPDEDFDTQQEIEEIRSEGLTCIASMVENFVPEIMEPYINEILGISARFITYDPYADDDDQDGEGSDMDEDEDDYEDSDIDEDYDDDDDSSGFL
ncbi:unnamed protein product [Ambrosiozyma monospora]|uniref:Unnamed protein product n=1 Tax=Ambrosiozyma monospora TaxID=43982 RepID=A0A9W7DPF6_AMBMO|nr:unnamed protein product [Ambrosiozyma monospora]